LIFPEWLNRKFDDGWKVQGPEWIEIMNKAKEIIQKDIIESRKPSREQRKERDRRN
jgi:hypothetical protein